jgi:type IV pilus assembly protein PilM
MFLGSKSVVGLDIGSSAVKAIELQPVSDGFKLLRFGFAQLPPEAIVQGSFMNAPAIASAVREACQGAGIKAKDAATSASGHAVIVKKITLPSQSSEELDETIRWEAEQYIPFDINEVNVDYQILQETTAEGQMDVLLVAAKKDLIDNYQAVIQDAGMNLLVMDVDAFALGNMYEFNHPRSSDSAVALVDVGSAFININVTCGGVPIFTRDITSGGNLYTEEIQKTLNLSFEEAERIKLGGRSGEVSKEVVPQEVEEAMREVSENLVGEIQRSLDFCRATTSSQPIEQIQLCGGSARVPGLARLIQERTEVHVEVADPFARIQVSAGADEEQLQELAPALCVAVGLGMRRSSE